jgi:hypothetical protein
MHLQVSGASSWVRVAGQFRVPDIELLKEYKKGLRDECQRGPLLIPISKDYLLPFEILSRISVSALIFWNL